MNNGSIKGFESFVRTLTGILLVMFLAGGCKPKSVEEPAAATSGYFKTQFQTESQFIVEAIVSDLAEQVYYAANHRLPDKKSFLVAAREKSGSPVDSPIYKLSIRLDPKLNEIKMDVNVNGPIWSPEVYQGVAEKLASVTGLKPGGSEDAEDTKLVSRLVENTAEVIEQENQALSAALEKDFSNPDLHEKAGLLLGSFLLQDHAGYFFEIRSPLCRMTAHLAMAHFLGGGKPYGINGQMSEAVLLTLVGNQAPALEALKGINSKAPAVGAMTRALRARNTGDYRPLDAAEERTPIESISWFSALAGYGSTPAAWSKLNDSQRGNIEYIRSANEIGYSVEMGHQLLAESIPLEMSEISSIYELSRGVKLSRPNLVPALNEMPERCFGSGVDGKTRVRVIGWGQWANFFQRHLCHAVQQNFHMMNKMWGVPDDAKQFASKCEQEFTGLRLYPFVRRFNCTDVEGFHRAVDDGLKVTINTPHLVPAECWNYLCYRTSFAPQYLPNPNPHVNEWHNHNPPPGTMYDIQPRLDHPSLIERTDAAARFDQLRELAPYDCRIANRISRAKYHDQLTHDQAMELYGAMLPYGVYAVRTVAGTVYEKSGGEYEKLMLQAAEVEPSCYFDLGARALKYNQTDKAADYYEKGAKLDADRVRVASYAIWRVRYYLGKGQKDKARKIADEGGEVYSGSGLEAKGIFFEMTGDYAGAFEWFAKVEERYDNSNPVINFCLRYKAKTGDQRFEPELKKRLQKLFPGGLEKVTLESFKGAPPDGVLIKEENELIRANGLKVGDVIVAAYGVRVHTTHQYDYARELKTTPELDLIVWQGQSYREIKPNLPNHKFGVQIGDFRSK